MSPNPDLTAREIEVIRLPASGRSNRAIAEALFLSEATVKPTSCASTASSEPATARRPSPKPSGGARWTSPEPRAVAHLRAVRRPGSMIEPGRRGIALVATWPSADGVTLQGRVSARRQVDAKVTRVHPRLNPPTVRRLVKPPTLLTTPVTAKPSPAR
ncbi:LuxR C-terminal-related transcriptional regulator [Amycolatopsis sp. NPDC051716]|uniref:response regulator transcription factor n=1 Tax=Amycolatopsis sp. NPDC051716 TaxID=3155804 RepID=UPI003448396E